MEMKLSGAAGLWRPNQAAIDAPSGGRELPNVLPSPEVLTRPRYRTVTAVTLFFRGGIQHPPSVAGAGRFVL